MRRSALEADAFATQFMRYKDNWVLFPPTLDHLSPEVLHWANTTDAMAYWRSTLAPSSDFIIRCAVGHTKIPCPKPQIINMVWFGMCYTMLGTADTAYAISESSHESQFTMVIDVQQHEYALTISQGAGVRVRNKKLDICNHLQNCNIFVVYICRLNLPRDHVTYGWFS